jgi:hypothetical protein
MARLFFLLCLAGCIRPPEIVLVDRATALEQQAGGSFEELQGRLERMATTPRPTPLTPEQLQTLGIRTAPIVDDSTMTDADRVDLLLKQRCLGEGKDGRLVETDKDCQGAADRDLIATLIERTNGARSQLWRWMHDRRPASSADDMRKAWHDAHLKGVVCDGWIEKADSSWEAKKC